MDNHLKWCLEEEQVKLLEPSKELSESYMEKARESLEAASLLEKEGFYDWSVSVSYYACYFALSSLLRRCGVGCENHSCAIKLFEDFFVGKGELDESLLHVVEESKRRRIEKQYQIGNTTLSLSEKQRKEAINFVSELGTYLEVIREGKVDEVRVRLKSLR